MKIAKPFTLGVFSDWDSKFDTSVLQKFVGFLLNFFLHYHKPENSEKWVNHGVCNYTKIFGYLKIRAACTEINRCLPGPIISF